MEIERSTRIEGLRSAILTAVPTVGVERGRVVTEAYRENEADPILIKRAKVAGYSALYTELGVPCQNELIRRTEHSLS